jgi:hypothetical protein
MDEMRTVYDLLHERRAHPHDRALPLDDTPLRDVHSIIKMIDDTKMKGFTNSQVERAEHCIRALNQGRDCWIPQD